VLKGVFLLKTSLHFISRLFLQVYIINLVVNLVSKVLIVAYLLFKDHFGEFQVLT
jgi:hypothetical protein